MSSAAVEQDFNDYRHRTYDLKTPDQHRAVYDQWAASYNDDVLGSSTLYVGPRITTELVLSNKGAITGEILDAGCGTGLCGVALQQAGAKTIDGIDISDGMLAVAKNTGAYRDLSPADMQKKLELPSDKYDVVTCVGTFTTGHVGASPALEELVRVMKKGGLFVATVLVTLWKSEGFEDELNRLNKVGQIDLISTDIAEYRQADEALAHMVVFRKK